MVNRGRTYWDGESAKIVKANPDTIKHCKADRKDDSFCSIVSQFIIEQGLPLSHIIDFSCFKV